ncbi:MAG: hypothetical protein KIS91_02030 [Anaerolineae bacterium]|nr:hypothetical protein [Anaerolineae bacterium]
MSVIETAAVVLQLTQHPLSAAFPAMSDDEFDSLAEDIRRNGQREAGITYQGAVLDGWHRYRACVQAGIGFQAREFDGEDPVAFVLSRNLHRRHLTASQRAAAVVRCSEWREVGRPGNCAPGAQLTADAMADTAHVSRRTIVQAKAAQQAGLGDALVEGKVSAKQAAELAKLPESERERALEHPKPRSPQFAKAHDVGELQLKVEQLEADNAELRERMAELADQLKETLEDNASMVKVFEANDKLAEAVGEIRRLMEIKRVLEERIRGLQNERNAAIRLAKAAQRAAGGR